MPEFVPPSFPVMSTLRPSKCGVHNAIAALLEGWQHTLSIAAWLAMRNIHAQSCARNEFIFTLLPIPILTQSAKPKSNDNLWPLLLQLQTTYSCKLLLNSSRLGGSSYLDCKLKCLLVH
eukprot:846872-Amphidinium_carterae.1